MSEEHVPMEAVLDGAIYLVSLPLAVWGFGGKGVYSLIKLRFYNVMQQRAARSTWNQDRPVFFMCDEFQEIVSSNKDGLSDLNFWDKSRSSKTIGVISAQAIASFYASIGDHDMPMPSCKTFGRRFVLEPKTQPPLTTFTTWRIKSRWYAKPSVKPRENKATPTSFLAVVRLPLQRTLTTFVEKSVLSPQLFRKLQPGQAVALLSIEGHSMDDVIWMMPVFV